MRRRVYFVYVGLTVVAALPLNAQQIRGRVVDEPSRQAVRDASVMLLDTLGTIITGSQTGADGFFQLRAPSPGRYTVAVQQPGFAVERRSVNVGSTEMTLPAFVLRVEAIALDSIAVEQRASQGGPSPAGFQRVSHILAASPRCKKSLPRLRTGGRLYASATGSVPATPDPRR